MTDSACSPVPRLVPDSERAGAPDRLADLLETLADLRVETARQRSMITSGQNPEDPRVAEALGRLSVMESHLGEVAAEAAAVHQILVHDHLV